MRHPGRGHQDRSRRSAPASPPHPLAPPRPPAPAHPPAILRFSAGRLARALVILLLLTFLTAFGCGGGGRLDTDYGRRRGSGAGSVNGTSVLARMFQQAGFRVTSWSRLSPKIEDFDVLVWTPDSFQPPSEEEREYLEDWLRGAPNRTLIYVGRDYDAEIDYWSKMLPLAPPEQVMEINRRLARARARYAERRSRMPEDKYARWFVVRRGEGPRDVQQLESPLAGREGERDWAQGIDPRQADMVLAGHLDVPRESDLPRAQAAGLPDADVLLASGDAPLILRITDRGWRGSKILVVANGSFLLNLPLVNHEHRKLADRLIDACGAPGEVGFLESGPEGLTVMDEEPETSYPTGAEVFTVWPLGFIVMHLVVWGILFCFAEFPIFGRAKSRPERSAAGAAAEALVSVLNIVVVRKARQQPHSHSDFGHHIAAMGELLHRTGDVSYAQARLQHYQQHVRRDPAAAQAGTAQTPQTPPALSQTTGSIPHE